MTFGERIEWLFRIGLLVFVLAAAAFLSAVTAMRFAIQGREVDMPNLVGKSSAEALAILQGRGLQLKIADRVYSDLPLNAVVRQSPPAGEHMKISQDAHAVLSLGSQNVTTPCFGRGKPARGADSAASGGPSVGRINFLPGLGRPGRHHIATKPRSRSARFESSRGSAGSAKRTAALLCHAVAGRNAAAGCGSIAFFKRIKIREDHL